MLGYSISIASIKGIPVKVHWSFILLFIWVGYIGFTAGMNSTGILRFCLFTIILFVCIILHEYGHALTAQRFGVKTKDIIISPIGGVARLKKIPEKPRHEFLIAIAGPAVNLVISVIIGFSLWFFSSQGLNIIGDQSSVFNYLSNFLPMLFWLNIMLIVFNLLPAFPMDGGRILRSLLSIRLGRKKATRVASVLGQGVALFLIGFAIFEGELILGIIGIFVFFSAANEYRMVRYESFLSSKTVSSVFRSNFTIISVYEDMTRPIDLLNRDIEHDFLVGDSEGKLVGVLHEEFILEAMKNKDFDGPVYQYVSPKLEPISLSENLKELFYKLQNRGYSILPVYNDGQLVGVVDRRTLNNFIRIHQGILKFGNR
jgi:Zn-dependent protease